MTSSDSNRSMLDSFSLEEYMLANISFDEDVSFNPPMSDDVAQPAKEKSLELPMLEDVTQPAEENGTRRCILGLRFKPTDRQLVFDFLLPKALGFKHTCDVVLEFDIYTVEPWRLPNDSQINGGGIKELYFMFFRKTKGRSGSRMVTSPVDGPGGWWKASTGDKVIFQRKGDGKGFMKTLVFYKYKDNKSSKDALKTNWIMHEYRISEYQDWVICKIKEH